MSTDAERLAEHTRRHEYVREKLAIAAHHFQGGRNRDGALCLLDGLGGFMGMIRDYGDMPSWRLNAVFEYQITTSAAPLTILSELGRDGWELVHVAPNNKGGGFELWLKRMIQL